MEFHLIIAIVNQGYADEVMEASIEAGARGGTLLDARGTARAEAEKRFNIVIHPEKEMVFILVRSEIKDAVLHAIYKKVGLNSLGQGIAFALPVDQVVGLVKDIKLETKEGKY